MASHGLTGAKVALFLVVVLAILLGGALIAIGGLAVGLLFSGAMVAVFLVFMPAGLSVWLLLIVAFLVVGQLNYFAGLQKAFWIPFLMGTLLMVRVFLELPKSRSPSVPHSGEVPVFLLCVYLFFSVFLFSIALNKTSPFTVLVSSKNYLFVWSVMFLIGLGTVAETELEKLWRFFLWVGILQLPFAVVERLVFAKRAGVLNWDAVVGTFGGNPDGGGASAAMALFLVFTMLLASSLYSAKRISRFFHWSVLLSALGAIALAEVKVVFVILPIGYVWLFRKQIPHNVGRTLVMGTLLSVILAGVFLIYKTTLYSNEARRSESVEMTIERLLTYQVSSRSYNSLPGEISRGESLVSWWVLNPISKPAQFLFGHGPGASRVSQTAGVGEAARKYGFNMSINGASVLLWDVGLGGYLAFVLILAFGALRAEREARNKAIPDAHRCMLRANAAVLVIAVIMTMHNRDAIDFAPVQLLISTMLGHLLFIARRYSTTARAVRPAAIRYTSHPHAAA